MEIAVEGGRIRGRLETDVVAWQAIPYAAPPVGELRLRSPRPVRSWRRVRDATRFRDALLSHPLSSPLGTFRRRRRSPRRSARSARGCRYIRSEAGASRSSNQIRQTCSPLPRRRSHQPMATKRVRAGNCPPPTTFKTRPMCTDHGRW
ncbi:carboxylesterase family protein [Nocardia niigatensis]